LSELCALVFGALLIMIDFGDGHIVDVVGNLDAIFGLDFWRVLDVLIPALSVLVFLLYGKVKGGFRFNKLSALAFVSFIVMLVLITVDDIGIVLHFHVDLSKNYWRVVEWVFPLVSAFAFFIFGKANQPRGEKMPLST
jgi:hypothetical protein